MTCFYCGEGIAPDRHPDRSGHGWRHVSGSMFCYNPGNRNLPTRFKAIPDPEGVVRDDVGSGPAA